MPFAPAPAAPRVLVVDDHRKIREPLAIYLRRHSFEVRTAEDAAGMWQLLKTQALMRSMAAAGGTKLCS